MAAQLSDALLVNEKSGPSLLSNDVPLTSLPSPHSTSRPSSHFIPIRASSSTSSSSSSFSQSLPQSQRYVRPRGLRIWNLFKQWLPILAYAATSLGFVLAIAFWKTEVFDGEYLSPVYLPSLRGPAATPVPHSHDYDTILCCTTHHASRQVLTNSHTGCETMNTLATRCCSSSSS